MSGNAFVHMIDKEAEFCMAWLKGYALGMPSLHVEAFTISPVSPNKLFILISNAFSHSLDATEALCISDCIFMYYK